MFRSLSQTTRVLAATALFAAPVVASAQDNRPVIVVFAFSNSSMGAGKAEFDGVGTAVQDLLITDLASNSKFRVVDRNSIDAVLKEQGMVKGGQVDAATAVRLGKIMGAQYAVTGGFLSDGHGTAVLTGRTIDMETTQIANPQKITGKSENVLGIITELSEKLASMKLESKPGAVRKVGDAGDAAKSDAGKSDAPKGSATQSGSPAGTPAATHAAVQYAKSVPPAGMKAKLDIATMKVYSNALDEMDRKNNSKAAQLFQQVVEKFPDFQPAKDNLKKVQG